MIHRFRPIRLSVDILSVRFKRFVSARRLVGCRRPCHSEVLRLYESEISEFFDYQAGSCKKPLLSASSGIDLVGLSRVMKGRAAIFRAQSHGAHRSFIDGWLKVHPHDRATGRKFLEVFPVHLSDNGIGTISEVFDAREPHLAGGCIAQAWSVAEVLRAWSKTA